MLINQPPKIAVIHDWLFTHRGGEQVLQAILELYPSAEVFTLFHRPGKLPDFFRQYPIHTSFIDALPWVERYYRHLLPVLPYAVERFDLSGFDLVISSSHCVAKGIIPSPGSLHVCYCHTPMRYAWDRYWDYFGDSRLEPLIHALMHSIRNWDVTSSARVDHFITNSNWVGERIRKYYRRDYEVIPPFVDLAAFKPIVKPREDYYLVASAFAPYKRIDLAIEACERLGKRLIVVGEGQQEKKLRRLRGPLTEFRGRVSLEELKKLYAGARALLFPGEEDFGITPLEAMAMGTPVIAFGRGGVLDSVVSGETGLFFYEQTVESLSQAIEAFERIEISAADCRERAGSFSRESFQNAFRRSIEQLLAKHDERKHHLPKESVQSPETPWLV